MRPRRVMGRGSYDLGGLPAEREREREKNERGQFYPGDARHTRMSVGDEPDPGCAVTAVTGSDQGERPRDARGPLL